MTIQGSLGGLKVPDADISAILMKRLSILGTTLRARDLEYKVRPVALVLYPFSSLITLLLFSLLALPLPLPLPLPLYFFLV